MSFQIRNNRIAALITTIMGAFLAGFEYGMNGLAHADPSGLIVGGLLFVVGISSFLHSAVIVDSHELRVKGAFGITIKRVSCTPEQLSFERGRWIHRFKHRGKTVVRLARWRVHNPDLAELQAQLQAQVFE